MLRHQGLDDFENLLLLTAGQLGHGFKHRACLAARFDRPPYKCQSSLFKLLLLSSFGHEQVRAGVSL
jgi:hypothetical protein